MVCFFFNVIFRLVIISPKFLQRGFGKHPISTKNVKVRFYYLLSFPNNVGLMHFGTDVTKEIN